MKPRFVTIQMKATKQYVYVVLFIIMALQGGSNLSVNETLVYDHSNESY